MKELLQKPSNAVKTEFWAVTTLFAFFIFFFIADGLNEPRGHRDLPSRHLFEKAQVPFHFYRHYFIPRLLQHVFVFAAFLYLNFLIIPQLVKRQALAKNVLTVLLVFVGAGFLFGITDTYLKTYLYAGPESRDSINREIYGDSSLYVFSLFWILAFYTAIKYVALTLFSRAVVIHKRYHFLRPEGLVATGIWLIGLLLLSFGGADEGVIVTWIIIIPSSILIYLLGFYKFIPSALRQKHPFIRYIFRNLILLLLFLIVVTFLLVFTDNDDHAPADISFLNVVFQSLVTVPLTWVLYKRHLRGNEEVLVLKKELEQSTANVDFLRSQINPHFLFNALNTIYGTALQEGAERTSAGIEKLGDMMRFMLHENLQDKISLAREVNYLENYISLQKLRTNSSPAIQIRTKIRDRENNFQIAPMLLIPFVENAFKHGISFRKPSHIAVSLVIKNNTLYFEVHNSRHEKMENDPEKDKSGIGLENVRQRLNLAYPNRHELVIRETAEDFFVHLTIQLS